MRIHTNRVDKRYVIDNVPFAQVQNDFTVGRAFFEHAKVHFTDRFVFRTRRVRTDLDDSTDEQNILLL